MELIGQTLGQYHIVEAIGRGGMATVFKAQQAALERFVAVKILMPQQAATLEGYLMLDRNFVRENRKSAEGGIGHACEIETSVMLHLAGDLVDMSMADATDMMTSGLATCPVDFASTRKKKMYLSTWYLENPTHGAAGDPSQARAEFGEALHRMTVDGLAEAITEFSEVHRRLAGRKLKRKDTRF
jgi:hypothetical protein